MQSREVNTTRAPRRIPAWICGNAAFHAEVDCKSHCVAPKASSTQKNCLGSCGLEYFTKSPASRILRVEHPHSSVAATARAAAIVDFPHAGSPSSRTKPCSTKARALRLYASVMTNFPRSSPSALRISRACAYARSSRIWLRSPSP